MLFLHLSLLFGFIFTGNAQEPITKEAVQDSIITQLGLYPQEKIHLHTDRAMYVSGEKIWFRAYAVDAFSHRSPTDSRYAYVELISPADSLAYRVMVSLDEHGLFHGNIFLSDNMPEGEYTLRAYTRYMENAGDDYFFRKPVRIYNLKKATEQQTKRQTAVRQGLLPGAGYEVSFYPEGGYLTEGVACRVAFKALNSAGASEHITGEVVDHEGNRIDAANTVYAGMGLFNIMPEPDREYYFQCSSQSGIERRFRLPAAKKTYSLAVARRSGSFLVEVKKTPGLPEQPLYLLAHCRGVVLYFAAWDYRSTYLTFLKDWLPSGTIQFTLFDGGMNPLSERLIFNRNDDQATLVFSPDRSYYQKREKVTAGINITDPEGNPLAGHVSVAVTDDRDITVDNSHTILSSLLLSSELRGYIESPGYYLQDDAGAVAALDLLMLTHGWRRYDIPEALKGHYTLPKTGFEEVKEITGTVKSLLPGRPVAKSEVLMLSNEGDFERFETDSAGFFRFYIHPPDSIKYFIQALTKKESPRVELALNRETFPALNRIPKIPLSVTADSITGESASIFVKKAEQRVQYDDDMMYVQLPEVAVTARVIPKRDEVRLSVFPFNSSSDRTIYREDFEHLNVPVSMLLSIFDAGIRVYGGTVIIRNYGPALIVIDGIPVEYGMLDDLVSVYNIESIDIFKGATAAVFGMRGANGAISVTTRRGTVGNLDSPVFNRAVYTPTGYQRPVEFYAPKYDTPLSKNSAIPDYRSTLFWKPDIIVADDGRASFDFYASDLPTTYTVTIEGLSTDGRIICQVETIEVK